MREADEWGYLIDGDTNGYRKLDRFDAVTADAISLQVTHSHGPPLLTEIAAFLDGLGFRRGPTLETRCRYAVPLPPD